MSRTATTLFGAIAALVLAGAALAADDKSGRYTMSPTDGGFVRLDTETGDMAFCKRSAEGAWACEAMPDSQIAMRRDLDRLKQENEALKQGDKSANATPPPGAGTHEPEFDVPPPPPPRGSVPIPTEQDVDKLFDYVEGMAKKLKERLKKLEEEKPSKEGTPL